MCIIKYLTSPIGRKTTILKEKIILGVDPGTTIMGYAILQIEKSKITPITLGVIDLKKFNDHYLKLQNIYKRVQSLVDEFHPDELALEAPFYGKNVQSMLKLGRAQGVAMAAGLSRDVPIFEYAPRKVKMSTTGSGSASKEQVAGMLEKLLQCKLDDQMLDATDAMAVALCHHYQTSGKFGEQEKKYNSWKDFIGSNPKRIK